MAEALTDPADGRLEWPAVAFTFSEKLTTCDLCGSRDFAVRDEAKKVVQCRHCGYRFLNPRPSQSEIAEAYSAPQQYDTWLDEDLGRQVMWKKRWGLVKRHAQGTRLLDVGAGIGTFLANARDDGWSVSGTEVSRSAIAIARERYGIEIAEGQLGDATVSGPFDVVSMWHVLEHLPSPSQGLRQCRSLLREGGLLVVAVPNDSDARWRFQRAKNGSYMPYEDLEPGKEIHLSHFTVPVLRSAIRSNGFRIELMTVDDHYPTPSARTDQLVRGYRALMAVTRVNLGIATLALATAV
jgi:SAM-dependent methyltransferase